MHIGEIGKSYIEEMILFRDYLCKHKDIAKEYAKLKKQLAQKHKDNREVYTEKKEKFIKQIIKKAKKQTYGINKRKKTEKGL